VISQKHAILNSKDLLRGGNMGYDMERQRLLEYNNLFSGSQFEAAYFYQGNDLGAIWSKNATDFRVWAPTASQVILNLYRSGDQEDLVYSTPMLLDQKGTWFISIDGDLHGVYYTYEVTVDGETKTAVDPYARAVGVNGKRGMIINLAATDPPGFVNEKKPDFINPTDAIIYELHIRDFSIHPSSGMKHKGKYLAFTEQGTTNSFGGKTGVDYLKDLGITHVHLLPAFDFMTIDETRLGEAQYNWGYDPQNYNVPEGSYSTNPYHGEVRIYEFKRMIQALHRNGIRVIMDVVYNHTMESEESNFNKIVPGYYYRLTPEGYFSNASGCGNETASERAMMRKFIIDSVIYWASQYHIDGFRFDLMGIHDIQTMNELRSALNELDPSILLYGEGWTGGLSPMPEWKRAVKQNIKNMNPGIAAFNDNFRDAIKGSVFRQEEQGYVSGRGGMEETIKACVTASIWHQDVDYGRVNASLNAAWAAEPTQTVNYISSHDNLTLWDKLTLSNQYDSEGNRRKRNLLAAAILFTSQGMVFFMAGEEFLRSKPKNAEGTVFDDNSYRSSDEVNSLKWNQCKEKEKVLAYYKGLIAFRKAHSGLRMTTAKDIRARLRFLEWSQPNVITFMIRTEGEEELCIIYNSNSEAKTIHIPQGEWRIYGKGNQVGTQCLGETPGGSVVVEAISALFLVRTL
jgi:pullulanase